MAGNGGAKRGGSSGSSSTKAEKKLTNAMDAQNIDELIDYMETNYGFKMFEANLNGVEFETAKEQVSALEDIFQEFPGALNAFNGFKFGSTNSSTAYGEAEMSSGIITCNTAIFKDRAMVNSKYNYDLRDRFHPNGTTYRNITTHEAGHILERAIVMKYLPGNRYAQVDAYKSRKFADKIIDLAMSNLGKSKSKDFAIGRVSKYAKKNVSEALAECVTDYIANRSEAKPLSKEVYKVLKQELG